jgi:hypothetical protein
MNCSQIAATLFPAVSGREDDMTGRRYFWFEAIRAQRRARRLISIRQEEARLRRNGYLRPAA